MNASVTPEISILVCAYNMQRELPRTVYTLSSAYQTGLDGAAYELVVLDNGSTPAVDGDALRAIVPHVRVIRPDVCMASPARAINAAMRQLRGELLGLWIDGARLASPGIVGRAVEAWQADASRAIGTLAFHLGPDVQMRSVFDGYDVATEDALLASVPWRQDGYRLFDIAVPAGSSAAGWFGCIEETNGFFADRGLWHTLGGLDERFAAPGGGFVNLDLWRRAVEASQRQPWMILGEGTFHQVHGGAATNGTHEARAAMGREYEEIHGCAFEMPTYQARFVGNFSGRRMSPVCPVFQGAATSQEPPTPRAGSAARQAVKAKLRKLRKLRKLLQLARIKGSVKPKQPTAPLQRVLLVLGMHRSGTSALSGLLCQQGFLAPHNPVCGDANNPTGYWEPQRIRDFHDGLMESVQSSWHDPLLPVLPWQPPHLEPALAQLEQALAADFPTPAPQAVALIKDPRQCRLLPLWNALFAQRPLQVAVVLAVRPPEAVAASLLSRDQLPPDRGLLLWLSHTLEAERATRQLPRLVLSYEQLLQDPVAVVQRCQQLAGLPITTPSPEWLSAWIRPELNRHRGLPEGVDPEGDTTTLLQWANTVYAALLEPAAEQQRQALDRADQVVRQMLQALLEQGDGSASRGCSGCVVLKRAAGHPQSR